MKNFDKIIAAVIAVIAAVFMGVNLCFYDYTSSGSGRPYRVEINRIALEIEENGLADIDLSSYEYVTDVVRLSGDNSDFFQAESDYMIREIGGELYWFDYRQATQENKGRLVIVGNIFLGIMALLMIGLILFIRQKILLPFEELTNVPYELSKGNLTVPIKESKSRFFGRFIWGIDLLRENMETQKRRELQLQKEKKTLLLSLSHDIKTPLSAIKLYAGALSKGLYAEKEREIAAHINAKADEIEDYVSRIVSASKEDFLRFEVSIREFYLSALMGKIETYYRDKLSLVKTDFSLLRYTDCLLKGDPDRSVEVLQNIMENAVKYGDGRNIAIGFAQEDGCLLITVENSGCTLADTELPHLFESFWRGANSENIPGSGLGLYICRQLMHRMGGEIFAELQDGMMRVTAVFVKV
ncbi:MAG: HAMP domain-containing histidine kinase [Lachnospiraceae bacterium]|nr:HAMP domain-containing histidine kinase [Lachnospiraceae bacterium]